MVCCLSLSDAELLDLLESRIPSPDEYKMLASGRRPAKSPALGGFVETS